MSNYILLFLISVISLVYGCSSHKIENKSDDSKQESLVIDLATSARIVSHLIATKNIHELLQEVDESELNRFVINTTPAQIALEAEILSKSMPGFLLFYKKDKPDDQVMAVLTDYAGLYASKVLFAIVDLQELYALEEMSQIDDFPAVIVLKDRSEMSRIEGIKAPSQLEAFLQVSLKPFIASY